MLLRRAKPARRLSGAAKHMLVAEAALIEGKPAPSTAYVVFSFTLSSLWFQPVFAPAARAA